MEFAVSPLVGFLHFHHALDVIHLLEHVHFNAGCISDQANDGCALAENRAGLDAVRRLQPTTEFIHFGTGGALFQNQNHGVSPPSPSVAMIESSLYSNGKSALTTKSAKLL